MACPGTFRMPTEARLYDLMLLLSNDAEEERRANFGRQPLEFLIEDFKEVLCSINGCRRRHHATRLAFVKLSPCRLG